MLIKQSLFIPSFPQSLETTSLLSVSMVLPITDISHKWNHTICVLLHLVSFT